MYFGYPSSTAPPQPQKKDFYPEKIAQKSSFF